MGKKPLKSTCLGLFAIVVPGLLYAHSTLAQSREEIGTVVTARGAVSLVDTSGAARRVTRRDVVHEGDTVIVGEEGFASFRMLDNAHVSFGPSTEFVFDTFRYDARPGTRDSVVMNLRRGCFRARAGTAGLGTRDEYRVETSVARITVDASYHGAALVGDRLYTATWDGATVVSNAQGSLALGGYGKQKFSRTFPGEAPKGLAALLPGADCEAPEALDGELEQRGTYRIERDEDEED